MIGGHVIGGPQPGGMSRVAISRAMSREALWQRWISRDIGQFAEVLTLVFAALLFLDNVTRFVVDLARGDRADLPDHGVRALSTVVVAVLVRWPMVAFVLWLGIAPFSRYQALTVVAWMLIALRMVATRPAWQAALVTLAGAGYEVWGRTRYAGQDLATASWTAVGAAGLVVGLGTAGRLLIARRVANTELAARLELASDQQREGERSLLARDLHDGLAHELSVITLQAMAARHRDAEGQREALDTALASSSSAMAELRGLVSLLRDDTSDPWVDQSSVTVLAGRMAETLASRGMHLAVVVDPRADEVAGHSRQTLLRILKEAATNVMRHAPVGASCSMTVRVVPGQIVVEVVNPLVTSDLLGASADEAQSADRDDAPGPPPAHGLSTGWGLLGLRERLSLVGGRLDVGRAGDTWRLVAVVPVAEVTR